MKKGPVRCSQLRHGDWNITIPLSAKANGRDCRGMVTLSVLLTLF
jgi:hypothetical protein